MAVGGVGANVSGNFSMGGGEGMHHTRRVNFLGKLQSADPATQKQMLSDLAGKLQQRANGATGARADRLNQQLTLVQKAETSGDYSDLQQLFGSRSNDHMTYSSR